MHKTSDYCGQNLFLRASQWKCALEMIEPDIEKLDYLSSLYPAAPCPFADCLQL